MAKRFERAASVCGLRGYSSPTSQHSTYVLSLDNCIRAVLSSSGFLIKRRGVLPFGSWGAQWWMLGATAGGLICGVEALRRLREHLCLVNLDHGPKVIRIFGAGEGMISAVRWLLDSVGAVLNVSFESRSVLGAMAAGLLVVGVPQTSFAQSMTLSGKFSVGTSGAASYNIPIAVPPGTAGLTPSLSLEYDSQGGNGLLGMGWSLGGLPSIGRCPRTVAQDGVLGGVNFDANDRFCMDGQRLVVVSGGYGADGAQYRTEVDTFSKIISHGTAGNGPAWFEVHAKSGQIMEFGHTADSLVLAQGKATARNWALDKISDTKGNYFSVTYTNDATNGQAYPIEIDYTGNTAASLAPNNKVQFLYAIRPDVTPQYQAGSLSQTTVRLTDVKTFSGTSLVADYRLAYQQNTSTHRSELTSITVCDSNGACMPSSKFGWSASSLDGTFTAPTGSGAWVFPYGDTFGSGYPQIIGDFNGDGKTDFALYSSTHVYVWLSNGDGTFTAPTGSGAWVFPYGDTFSSSYPLIVGDFNGDGKTDFALYSSTHVYVWLSNGDGTFTAPTGSGAWVFPYGDTFSSSYSQVVGDFDGDGKTDFALYDSTHVYVWLSNGDGTFTAPAGSGAWVFPYGDTFGSGYLQVVGDFDGDGKTDFALYSSTHVYVWLSNGDGTFTAPAGSGAWVFPYGDTFSSSYSQVVGDFNGDGKTDFALYSSTHVYVWVSNGDGTFTAPAGEGAWIFPYGDTFGSGYSQVVGDFNGDGKTDFALYNSTHVYVWVSNGDGTFTAPAGEGAWIFPYGDTFGTGYLQIAGDFNGDGKTDFAPYSPTHVYAWMANGPTNDLITSIFSGLGATTSITYAPLTNASVYSKDNTASYPQVDMQLPIYVVSQVSTSNGVGGTYSSSYSYAGAKLDLTGRGSLGFRQMTVKDLQTGINDTTNYRQDFPYIGLVTSTSRSSGSQTLSQSANTFQFSNTSGTTTISPSSAPYRVSLSQNVSSGSDLDGSALPSATTTNQYDTFGNATQIVISTSDGFSKTTANTYTNDTTNWYLGRLTQSSVTSAAP